MNSGFNRSQIREIILSAMRRYERKEFQRKAQNKKKFRHGKDTLAKRIRKKLAESTTWFKNNRDKKNQENEKMYNKEKKWRNENEKITDSPQAVLFVPFTNGSGLAKKIRETVQQLKPFTKIHLKVVERAGRKVIDTLHRSNPWEN